MKASHPLGVATLLACAALGVQAQTMKPGLWQVVTQVTSSSGEMEKAMAEMQKQLAAMSPEQRKMVQDMAGQQGMGMGGASGNTMKVCLTQAMVDNNDLPRQEGDCTHKTSPRSGNTMKFSFVCTQPPSSGEGLVTFTAADSYRSHMTVRTSSQGKPQTMQLDSTGTFLSSACGNVKPLVAPKK